MVLQLYGYPIATCTARVAVILHEKQVPFEFHSVDLRNGEHKTAAHLKYQPFGQVPFIIEDDGFVLYESRAIVRYLALKYADQGTRLIPSPTDDPKKIALFEQAASIELCNFDPYAAKYVTQKVMNPIQGLPTDDAAASDALATLDAKLDVYEQILDKQAYLAGDEVTVVDLNHLSCGSILKVAGSDIMESKPNVARWWKDISSRPAWISVSEAVSIAMKKS